MKKSFIFTYAILLLLTLTTALIASSISIFQIAVVLILGISAIKFLLVAFQFMELKNGNFFWKISLTAALVAIILVVILLIL